MSLVLVVAWCLVASQFLFALPRDRTIHQFYHSKWTAKDGAPSQITALTQTQDGYLWIGSSLGLFRFDGVTFEQYEPPGGVTLPSNNIYALMATPDGGLWISFRPSGLGFLKNGELTVFTRPEEIPKSPVYCFGQTPDGRVWAGTHDGLSLFNGAGWDAIGTDWGFQPNSVKTLFTDRDGTLWVSQEDSTSFLPIGSRAFQVSERPIKDDYPQHIAQDKDGRLWGTRVNNQVRPIKSPSFGSAVKGPILDIGSFGLLFDRDGCLWVASGETVNRIPFPERLGPRRLREGDGRSIETFTRKDGLSSGSAGIIFEDREGNIWLGTLAGLDRFRYSSIVPIVLPESSLKLTLNRGSGNEIWAGSSLVTSFLHLHDGQVEKVVLDPDTTITSSVYNGPDGTIWWGGLEGIWRQKDSQFSFFPEPKDLGEEWIWEIFRGEGDGGLWVSYGDLGLVYFKDGVWEKRKTPEGLPDRGPSATFEDDRRRIWLGYTENRVFVLDGDIVRGYSSANGIDIGRAKVIRGRAGEVWVGGETGLAYLKDDRFYTVKTSGKPIGSVSGIIVSARGDVWLNEAHGIVRIPADEVRQLHDDPDHIVRSQLFDFQDNLPGNAQMNYTVSTAVETPDGRLWFSTDNGIALIDPSRIEKNLVPPTVIAKSLKADEKRYEIGQNTSLPAGTTNLQITYTATSLSIPERVSFKYRLEGYENDWRDAENRREAYYTNLGPGKYRFTVLAANNDGVWNEQGASLEFNILPRFYQTEWFIALCFAAVLIFGFFCYQWRVHQVKVRMQSQFEERLAERTSIAQDLHDTLMQGVVSVAMQLEVATERVGEKSPAKPMLDHINGLMTNVITEGRNALKGLRSPTVSYLSDLEERFTHIRDELDPTGKINFRSSVAGQQRPLLSVAGEETHQICREALTNAFRHSRATIIEVEIEYGMGHFRVVIRDNGIGIDTELLAAGRDGHYGLSGMRERANRIGGRLKIYSKLEGGTEVEFYIPGRFAFGTRFSNRWLAVLRRYVRIDKENQNR